MDSTTSEVKLSSKTKHVGLFVYCNKCKNSVKRSSCNIKKGQCDFPRKHVFKLRLHVPGTKNRVKSVVLKTKKPSDAIKMAAEIYEDFKLGKYLPVKKTKVFTIQEYMGKFLGYCQKPTKNRKPVNEATVKDYARHLKVLANHLFKNKINVSVLTPNYITDKVAEALFESIGEVTASTQKKYFKTFRTFYNYLINEEKLTLPANPFKGWRFETVEHPNEIIYKEEFFDLMDAIENKPRHMTDSLGKKRNMYFPFLKNAIKLGLFTGGRRQEIPEIKWCDIIPNRNTGDLYGGVILLKDLKSTAIKKLTNIKRKPVEINDDLAELLIELGYNEMKGLDKYIIDTEEVFSRKSIKNNLSNSFAHYVSFVSARDLSFGCLRKTWFTNCAKSLGVEHASFMGGHSDVSLTVNHYINKIEAAGSNMKFRRIFS